MKKLILLLSLLILAGNVYGATSVSLPYTISNGTTADATEVQANDAEMAAKQNTHNAATTGEHGVTGTIVGTSDTQTFSNKTTGDMTWSTGSKAIFGNAARYIKDNTTEYAVEIDSHCYVTGNLMINTLANLYFDADSITHDTYVSEAQANLIRFTAGGTTCLDLTSTTIYPLLSTITGQSDVQWNSSTKALGYVSSSKRYKENIKPAETLLDKVMKLKVSRYDRKDGSYKNELGLIAEEVYPLFPEIVSLKDNIPESVGYSRLSVILLKALQEQQVQIDSLTKRIEKLEQKVGN